MRGTEASSARARVVATFSVILSLRVAHQGAESGNLQGPITSSSPDTVALMSAWSATRAGTEL